MISKRKLNIAVVGCGHVGLPLAICLANDGHTVIGVDNDLHLNATVMKGSVPFVEEGLQRILEEVLKTGRFSMTADLPATANGNIDAFILTLGTPLDPNSVPTIDDLWGVIRTILDNRFGQQSLIVLRSTVAPGTCQRIMARISLEYPLQEENNWWQLAYCPERIVQGKSSSELYQLPQIIGADDLATAAAAESVFTSFKVETIRVGLIEAELAKLFNNIYRYVNFALANECLIVARNYGAKIGDALKAANEGYPRGGPWLPGYAAGPCLRKDPLFISNQVPHIDLLASSAKINETMPQFMLNQAEQLRALEDPAVLGLGFKANSDDTRGSLGLKMVAIIRSYGLKPRLHDPLVKMEGVSSSLEETLLGAREVFVMVPHREYKNLPWNTLCNLVGPGCLVIDPWLTWQQEDVVVTV